MTTDQQLHRSSFNQLFRGALLDGLQLSSIIIPGGLVIHQLRQYKLSRPLSTSAHSTASSSPAPPTSSSILSLKSSSTSKISSLNYRLTHFLKWNGFLTFGFSLVYAALLTTSSSLIQNNIKPLSSPPKDKKSTSQILSNDYSVIGGTLGGLITATVFWNRRLLSLISIIPGGIGIGVGAGLSTAYLHSLQSRSPIHPNQPPTVDDS